MAAKLNSNRLIKTIGTAFRAYCRYLNELQISGQLTCENAISLVRTALLSYTARGWGGPIASGKKASKEDIEAITRFLDTLPLERLLQAVEVQQRVFDEMGIKANTQKINRYHLRKFVQWVADQGWLLGAAPSRDESEDTVPYKHSFSEAHRQGKTPLRDLVLTGLLNVNYLGVFRAFGDARKFDKLEKLLP